MHGKVAWLALALCVVLMGSTAMVRAQRAPGPEVGAGVDLLAGYDSNPTLALNPNARRDAAVAVDGPGPGLVTNVLGRGYALFGEAAWLALALNTDARLYHSGDARHDTSLSVLTTADVEPVRASLTLNGGRYDASFGVDDAWYGGVAPALRWALSSTTSLGFEAHAGARRYAGGGQTNWDYGGAFDLQLQSATWFATLGVDIDRRESSVASAARAQVTPFAAASLAIDAWLLSLRYAAFARWFDVGVQNGVEHTWELSARYRLGSLLSLSARVGAGLAHGQTDALRYDRLYAIAGLTFALGAARATVGPAAPDRTRQGAAYVTANTTRFSVCVPGAHEVAVVGTFNAWSPSAGRMQRGRGDCFAIELEVPSGHYRYQWMVDGVLARPDAAPAYAADGFGGEDAVLIVPE